MNFFGVPAYAKLNLSLEIGAKRSDGFHSLSSIFTKISLHDTISFRFHRFGKKRIRVFMDGKPADDSNSMVKAAKLYCRLFYPQLSLTIRCRKRIPTGGGLGGGSSNAAAVLTTLNRKYAKADADQLLQASAEIGSDVPFFLSGSAAYVSGRGEEVRPLSARRRLYGVLLLPDWFSSTATAYRLLDESGNTKTSFRNAQEEIAAFYAPVNKWHYDNDFLPILEASSPIMKTTADAIRALTPPFWNLSGSGSSFYALFETKRQRRHFFKNFRVKNVQKKNFFLV